MRKIFLLACLEDVPSTRDQTRENKNAKIAFSAKNILPAEQQKWWLTVEE